MDIYNEVHTFDVGHLLFQQLYMDHRYHAKNLIHFQ
jgi:hypothetical protein